MSLRIHRYRFVYLLVLGLLAMAGCTGRAEDTTSTEDQPASVPAVQTTVTAAEERALSRFLTVTGTLNAEEEADVAAEVAGRIVATPIERGTRIARGGVLVRIADVEVDAQVREAEANAAQIAARLGISGDVSFEIERVPEVANARAAQAQSDADFNRAQMLFDRKLLSQADYDRSRTQAEASRRQYETARNTAEQQYQSLMAARARVILARKALADTIVKAPFDGAVGERFVSVGDYVQRGTKIASVLRTDTLRVELTVPEQSISAVAVGREVALEVDAYPGRTFNGRVRFVSPAVTSNSRSLVVEAIVSNRDGVLKPGFFASARIEQARPTPGLLVPAAAVRTVAGTSRVFVVVGERVEERIVTMGQTVGDLVEITSGLQKGDSVAATNVNSLEDGVRIAAR